MHAILILLLYMLFLHDIIREAAARKGKISSLHSSVGKIDAARDYSEAWDCFNRYITAHFLKFKGVSIQNFCKVGWLTDGSGTIKPYFTLTDAFQATNSIEYSLQRPTQSEMIKFSDFNWIMACMKFSNNISKETFKSVLNEIFSLIGEHARLNHPMTIDFEIGKLFFQDRRPKFVFSSRVLQHPKLHQTAIDSNMNVTASCISGSGSKSLVYNPSANFDVPDDVISAVRGPSRMSTSVRRPHSENGSRIFESGNPNPIYNPVSTNNDDSSSTLTAATLEKLTNSNLQTTGMLQAFLENPSNHVVPLSAPKHDPLCNCEASNIIGETGEVDMREAERESPYLINEIRRLKNEAAAADIQSSELKERLHRLAASAELLLKKKHGKRNSNASSSDLLSALSDHRDAKGSLPIIDSSTEFTGIKSAAEESLDRYLTFLEVRAAQSMRERELFERTVQRGLEEEREEHKLKAAMTRQYREYLDSQIQNDKERQAIQRHDFIVAASTHEFPMMSESAPDKLKRESNERQNILRRDLERQISLNKALRDREKSLSKLHEAQVAALSQTESSNRFRLELLQKQQEKIDLIEAWERDLRMRNILKSIEKHPDHPQLTPLDLGTPINTCGANSSQAHISAGSIHNPVGPKTQKELFELHTANLIKFQHHLNQNMVHRPINNTRPSSQNSSLKSSASQMIALPPVAQPQKSPIDKYDATIPTTAGGFSFRPKSSGSSAGSVISLSGGARLVPGGASVSLQKQREMLKKSKSSGAMLT